MRILQVIGGVADDWGGPSKVVRELSIALAARGHEVEIVTTDVAPGGERLDVVCGVSHPQPGGYAIRYHRCELLRPPYLSLAHTADVLRRARRFDVAHVHSLFNVPVTAAQAALRVRRVPYVVRACGMLDAYSLEQRGSAKAAYLRWLERPNLQGAARIHVSTPFEAAGVRALGLRAPIAVIPQGVDPPSHGAGPPPHPRPYLLFLSRVAAKKGLLLLVEAFATLAALHDDLDLVIAGPDEHGHRAEVEAQVAARGIVGRVVFPGMVRGAAKAAWLGHAGAFVLPSSDENFGVVVVEAAQLGAPLIVSDRVGLCDAVAETGAGEVVPRQVDALVAAVERVLGRGRAAYAAECAEMASRFRWETAAARIEALYEAILAERSRS